LFVVLCEGEKLLNFVCLSTNQQQQQYSRLPSNDIALAHPSLSREHAVFQHRKNGNNIARFAFCLARIKCVKSTKFSYVGDMYVYDLDSTHGTFVNKARIAPRVYTLLKNGDFLMFGGSKRMYIVGGGPEPVRVAKQRATTTKNDAAVVDVDGERDSSAITIDDDGNRQLFTGNASGTSGCECWFAFCV
jgi:pSer/pThr/pTyr-binding forkhead associated (FHA) protein